MGKLRATVRKGQAAQYFANDNLVRGPWERDRGAWEQERPEERPEPEPEPPLNNGPYTSSYPQGSYSQQQHAGYGRSTQFQTPVSQQSQQQPHYASPGYSQQNGGYVQPPPGAGYGVQYQHQPTTAQGGQYPYGQVQNPHNQGYPPSQTYNQGSQGSHPNSQSVPESQAPFSPPSLTRAATTGPYGSQSTPLYCSYHGTQTYGPCPQCFP